MAGFHTLPDIPIEECDPFEQLSRNPLDDLFDLLGAHRIGH